MIREPSRTPLLGAHNPLLSAAVVATCLVLAVTSCSSGSPVSTTASSSVSAGDVNAAAAEKLPDDAVSKAVGRLDAMVSDELARTGIPGAAVAVVHGGKTVYAKGFGVADLATGRKVDADTVFQLASVSKSISASVVATQVTQNKVSWDTPVVANMPSFALSDPYVTANVTVGDLFAHRSGLAEHAGDKLEEFGYDRDTILQRLRLLPLQPFRTTYDYTNFGLTAAAQSVADKAGTDWATLADRSIFSPLGMRSTSMRYSDFAARTDRAIGHVKQNGRWVVTPMQREPDAQAPAGGASSSVNDMARWLAVMLADGKQGGSQVFSPDAILPATVPEIRTGMPGSAADRAGFYGYGFNAATTSDGRTTYSHSGAFASGAGTNFVVMPSADVAIIMLTNAAPIGVADAVDMRFMDLVQYGEERQPWDTLYGDAYAGLSEPSGSLVGTPAPSNPAPAQPNSAYVGTYQSAYWGPAVISDQNGGLTIALGPNGRTRYPLTHRDGNVFTFAPYSENAEPGSISAVTFDGSRMTVEYLTSDGNDGVFTRQ